MHVSTDIARRTDHMVSVCGLDSASIFLCDKTGASSSLSYLYHVGVTQEAQAAYEDGRVFEDDPFARVISSAAPGGQLIRWEDKRLEAVADDASAYRAFINHYSVDVVGAYVQQLVPRLYLLVGAHCRPGAHRKGDVAQTLFEQEIAGVAHMVALQLLGEILTRSTGRSAFDAVLDRTVIPCRNAMATGLSKREAEIASHICRGKQNKEVAWLTGLSEYTVENHLRRIYRKLGIHNRAAMVARLSGAHLC
ncbi:helix-turn-helix transcriptional regulator [Sphingobium boeckii]|uniref:DNA-binding CsgD family transcriptional regulator n=1 Tax=Sphingobium boeckii TaxID=1082345 RepID=A0A7W9AI29_9SPHN|nr:helix-turn-helix transcriptional regulator [Sphingobium boeckii]MBB5685869.1 DNA-binding CsgD family transcriptional regulator [Sphingobium boeckii]